MNEMKIERFSSELHLTIRKWGWGGLSYDSAEGVEQLF